MMRKVTRMQFPPTVISALVCALGLSIFPIAAHTQIKADPNAPKHQQPNVHNGANGVPVVDITAPSAKGVSRNKYSQFDVNKQGAILNNSKNSINTKLGGWIQGNGNLQNGQAKIILNEVNSSNPSQLRGHIEVAGQQAQVIIANPAGITCDGCGFINANRATITTGTPVIINGEIKHYRVERGVVTLEGLGLDASTTDTVEILARAAEVNAALWANYVKITTGANEIDANSGEATAIEGTGEKPKFLLDVSSLGGIYGAKGIYIEGTEKGLGANMDGVVGAMAGDVVITTDGRLVNRNQITSDGNVTITSREGVDNSGAIYARGNTDLTSDEELINKGIIAAKNNTTLKAKYITNQTGATIGAGTQTDGSLGNTGTLTVKATKTITSSGRQISGGTQTLQANSIDLSNSHSNGRDIILEAKDGDIDLTQALVEASNQVNVQSSDTLITNYAKVLASQLSINAKNLTNHYGELLHTGTQSLVIDIEKLLDNSYGKIASNGHNITLTSSTLANKEGQLIHTGQGELLLLGHTINGAEGLINSAGHTKILATDVNLNHSQLLANNIHIVSNSLSNQQGKITQNGAGEMVITVAQLDNTAGSIISFGGTTLQASDLINTQGQLTTTGDVFITTDNLFNDSGSITSEQALTLTTANSLTNIQGIIAANNQVMINAGSVDNSDGILASVNETISLVATKILDNTAGRIESAKALILSSLGLTNIDGIISASSMDINSQNQSLDNSRGTIRTHALNDTGTLTIQSGRLINESGLISGQGVLSIDTHGFNLVNTHSGTDGGIIGQNEIKITTGLLTNHAGYFGSNNTLTIYATTLDNGQNGVITSADTITVIANNLDNQLGQLQAQGNITLTLGDTLTNSTGLIRSGATLYVNAATIDNTQTQNTNQGLEGQSIILEADSIKNMYGNLRADQDITLRSSSSIDNGNGLITSGRTITVENLISSAIESTVNLSISNDAGTLFAGEQLNVASNYLLGEGRLLSQGDLNLTINGDYTHSNDLEAAGRIFLTANGSFTNVAKLLSAIAIDVVANTIINTLTGEISAPELTITAHDTLTNRGLLDGQSLLIQSQTLNNYGTGRIYGDHIAIETELLNNDIEYNTSAVIAARNRLDIAALTLNNRENALLFSAGDMVIGASLNVNRHATGKATLVHNASATIEALGNLILAAVSVKNTNEHFETERRLISTEILEEYQGQFSQERYDSNDVIWGKTSKGASKIIFPIDAEDFYVYQFTRTIYEDVVINSAPGKILSGGNMTFDVGTGLNDKSQIVAGGNLSITGGSFTNTAAEGTRSVVDTGTVYFTWIESCGFLGSDHCRKNSATTEYNPAQQESSIDFNISKYEQGTTPEGTGTTIDQHNPHSISDTITGPTHDDITIQPGEAVDPITSIPDMINEGDAPNAVIGIGEVDTKVPGNSLFHETPDPNSNYIIETDPRFTDYRQWLSSDFMLDELGIDPANINKRLGDGFYEQRLLREQVAQLTGRRFLEGYSDDETQFQALMTNGATFAKEYQLIPGVALSATQMAQLTSDIVWLVEKEITLSNGQTTTALVPQLYTMLKEGDLEPTGSFMTGNNITLALLDEFTNSGTVAGRQVVDITAENIHNLAGRISGDDINANAQHDLNSIGGLIQAKNNLIVTAGNDINVVTTTRTHINEQGSNTTIDRVAGLYVTGDNGSLLAQAGNNFTLTAAALVNTDGSTSLAANNDVVLNTVTEQKEQHLDWDANNYRYESSRTDVGTSLQTQGDITLQAGNDIKALAANISSQEGAIQATAGRDIVLAAGESNYTLDEAHKHSSSGFLSKKTETRRDFMDSTSSIATTLSGDSTTLIADRNIAVIGSNVISTNDTILAAQNDISIEAATTASSERHFHHKKTLGLFSAEGNSVGFTLGSKQEQRDQQSASTHSTSSTLGSTEGSVIINAGNHYTQTGSDVLALGGDIAINAKQVTIAEVEDTNQSQTHTRFKQTGLTVALTSPIISAIQTAMQMNDAAANTKDTRMKLLAGAVAALGAKNSYDAVAANPTQLGGVNVGVSMGTSKSRSDSQFQGSYATGSNLTAGGDITISAMGGGKTSNITIQGSQVTAGSNIALHADNAIHLLASKNTSDHHSTNDSSSAGMGLSFGSNGLLFNARANMSDGNSSGSDLNWNSTLIDAGNQLTLNSGSDTQLKGAIAKAKQVTATIGGDLTIESLQDISRYKSTEQSLGGSLSIGYGVGSGSINIGNTDIDSHYASVIDQSGIRAGDGGFQIDVKNNTDLTGGVITSTEDAIRENKNSITTGTLTYSDIKNKAEYEANSTNIGIGYSSPGTGVGKDQEGNAQTGGTQVPGSTLPSLEGISATPPSSVSAEDSSESRTRSGISESEIIITDEDKQKERSGNDAQTTIELVNKDVSTEIDGSHALTPIFNEEEILAELDIAKGLSRELGTFLENRAKEIDVKHAKAKALEAQATDLTNGLSDDQRIRLLAQASTLREEANNLSEHWGATGTYRQITAALLAATTGNISATSGEFVQNMVVNYIQQQGASYIGDLVVNGALIEGSPLHAALHGIVACAGAASSSQNCGSGAVGAAASSVLTGLFSETDPDEPQAAREAKRNLLVSLVIGIAKVSDLDGATAGNAAGAAADNNWLATHQKIQMKKELAEADGLLESMQVSSKWAYIDNRQFIVTTLGVGQGLMDAGWSDIKGIAVFLANPIEGLEGLKMIVMDPEVRAQLGDNIVNELNAKLERMETALVVGGDYQAEQFGKDLGELFWQVGSISTIVGSGAKGSIALAKAGINVSSKGTQAALSGLAKYNNLAKKGGLIGQNGTPYMDFTKLSTAQKGVVGEVLGGENMTKLLPQSERVGRVPGVGQNGIDDLYKVKKPGVDYVIVEYKFGSSKLGKTKDGVQMSDDWLMGSNTGFNRIADAVSDNKSLTRDIRNAMDQGRIEKWLVHIDPYGKASIGILDKNAKLVSDPSLVSKLLGSLQ